MIKAGWGAPTHEKPSQKAPHQRWNDLMWAHRWSPNQGREARMRLHGCTNLEELIWVNKSQMVSQSTSDNICIPNVVLLQKWWCGTNNGNKIIPEWFTVFPSGELQLNSSLSLFLCLLKKEDSIVTFKLLNTTLVYSILIYHKQCGTSCGDTLPQWLHLHVSCVCPWTTVCSKTVFPPLSGLNERCILHF